MCPESSGHCAPAFSHSENIDRGVCLRVSLFVRFQIFDDIIDVLRIVARRWHLVHHVRAAFASAYLTSVMTGLSLALIRMTSVFEIPSVAFRPKCGVSGGV